MEKNLYETAPSKKTKLILFSSFLGALYGKDEDDFLLYLNENDEENQYSYKAKFPGQRNLIIQVCQMAKYLNDETKPQAKFGFPYKKNSKQAKKRNKVSIVDKFFWND